jgi:phosphatidylglycerophosphate synthase
MFDPLMRRLIDPPLNRAGAWLAARSVPANGATLVGLAIGLLAVPALTYGRYETALAVILVNRLVDGLDGAIARHVGPTAFGGYLDIVCDSAFYAAIPLGFALTDPANTPWAAVLLATFICTMSSFLGRAIMAAQCGEQDAGVRGRKSFFYAAGVIEGTETIAAFVLFCLFPKAFPILAGLFATLCAWTVIARLLEGAKTHSSSEILNGAYAEQDPN